MGTERSKRGLNLDINIVPFVDVMSCLTAFLLVTAVWVNTAHLKNEAAGRAKADVNDKDPPPKLSILIGPRLAIEQWFGLLKRRTRRFHNVFPFRSWEGSDLS